jgi:S-adenosylmethionine hydrolase
MITLASDFGSPYPAAMKGVILQETDDRLVDVAHDLPRQDVRAAAFWLREVLPYFPPAVHLVVVDPGVGTDRKAAVVVAGDHLLVGPDNGVLLPAARRIVAGDGGPEGSPPGTVDVYEWTDEDPASATFHGRDVFAPAAAAVHEAGVEQFADLPQVEPLAEPVELRFPDPEVGDDGATGEVLVVDDFGNVVTNVPGTVLDGLDGVVVNGESAPVRRVYAAVEAGERLVTVGSHGNVEFAVNRGRGDEAFGLSVGDGVDLTW